MTETGGGVWFVKHFCCLVTKEVRKKLLDDGIIAVHYADVEDEQEAWRPRHYKRGAKAIERFKRLGETNDWVIADYSARKGSNDELDEDKIFSIGRVRSGSHGLFQNKVRCKCYEQHRPEGKFESFHTYKILKFEKFQRLSPLEYGLLGIPFGRSTISRSRIISPENAEHMFKHERLEDAVESLNPGQLEVLCEEYLRAGPKFGLPKLQYKLFPVGRQLKDFDIVGKDPTGKMILVQVSGAHGKELEKKKKRLRLYTERAHRILIAMNLPSQLDEDIQVVDAHNLYKDAKSYEALSKMITDFLSPQE
jgi:hypothetical protein